MKLNDTTHGMGEPCALASNHGIQWHHRKELPKKRRAIAHAKQFWASVFRAIKSGDITRFGKNHEKELDKKFQ